MGQRLTVHRSCHVAFGEYLAAKRPHDPGLWLVALDRRCAAWRMDTYIRCRSSIDRFWRRAIGELARPVIAYGDTAFSPSGKGERAVPTRGMARLQRRVQHSFLRAALLPATSFTEIGRHS
jgi:hypothetical protein